MSCRRRRQPLICIALPLFCSYLCYLCDQLACSPPFPASWTKVADPVEGIRALGAKLYGRAGSPDQPLLGFFETGQILNELEVLFTQAKTERLDVSKYASWQQPTQELAYIYRLLEEGDGGQCRMRNDYKLVQVNKYLEEYQEYWVNVVPFLKTLGQNYYARCALLIHSNALEYFSVGERLDLLQLHEVIKEAMGGRLPWRTSKHGWLLDHSSLVDLPLLTFLNQRGVFEVGQTMAREQFLGRFKRLLVLPCYTAWLAFKLPADVIRTFPNAQFLTLVDGQALEYMEVADVCVGLGHDTMGPHLYDSYFAPNGKLLPASDYRTAANDSVMR